MKNARSINLSLLTSSLALSCSAVNPELQPIRSQRISVTSFHLKIENYNGSLAYGHIYVVTPELVSITWFGELQDEEPKVVFEAALSPQHREQMADLLQRLDVEGLNAAYVNPNIADGLQLSFEVSTNQGPVKSIRVANVLNKKLHTLVQQVNTLVPAKYMIHYTEPPTRDG